MNTKSTIEIALLNAERYFIEGKFEKAKGYIDIFLKYSHFSKIEMYFVRATCNICLRSYNEALDDISFLLKAEPDNAEYIDLKVKCLIALKKYKSAEESIVKLENMGHNTIPLRRAIGSILYESERWDDAARNLELALSKEEDRESRIKLATCYQSMGEFEKAISCWSTAIEIWPLCSELYAGRSISYSLLYKDMEADADIMRMQIAEEISTSSPILEKML